MRRSRSHIFLLLIATLLLRAGSAWATIYKYVDENGILHFSNVPNDPQYQPYLDLYPKKGGAGSSHSGNGYAGGIPIDPDSYDHLIRSAASHHQVDPYLVKAVIRVESNFDCLARSSKGALGLMQLMPETATDMEVADPFDPQDNIYGGTRYLSKMLSLFSGNLRLALAAYNAGPGRVLPTNQVPRIKETIDYVERVQHHYQRYKRNSSDRLLALADHSPSS